MKNEDDMLNDLLSDESSGRESQNNKEVAAASPFWDDIDSNEDNEKAFEFKQWQVGANDIFRPAGITRATIPPGVYDFDRDDSGVFAKKIKVITDNLIELPDNSSERVLIGMQKFWNMEDRYRKHGLLYKRGILLWGPPGCHAKGTDIVMYNGSIKKVEDVIVGDLLLGPDGKSRTVLGLCRGKDEMYKITPTKGEAFVVNGNHILSLTRSRLRDNRYPSILNTTVNEYINLTKCSQRSFKLYRSKANEFSSSINVKEPYLLGVWLGDGSADRAAITTADIEIKNLIFSYAKENNLHIREDKQGNSLCSTYFFSGDGGAKGCNSFINLLKENNIFENKHIPESYMTASITNRLEILAGLIDTDGGNEGSWRPSSKRLNKNNKGYFSITQKREILSNQIVRLARSLGFGVTIKKVTKTLKSRNFIGQYFRISIYGDIQRIPTKILRKQSNAGNPNKDHLRTGIKAIESLGIDNYYGFTLSDDHLYMTGDFNVHHNSGKTATISLLNKCLLDKGGIVVMCDHPRITSQGLEAIRRIEPTRRIICIMEDIDEIIDKYGEHDLLALLDGENQVENIVMLASTNYPDKLGARIVNRPSRFDERIFVGMPTTNARHAYLKNILGDIDELDKWVNDTEGLSIAHLREMTAAVRCLDQDYDLVLARLKKMKQKIKADSDSEGKVGF
jgi:hypothetical protein